MSADIPFGGSGWNYSIKDLEEFLADCRKSGLDPTKRVIRANHTGMIQTQFSDPAG